MKLHTAYPLISLFLIAFSCTTKPTGNTTEKPDTTPRKFPLPVVPIQSLKGDTVMLNEVGLDRDFVVVLFESGCEFCQYETKSIDSVAPEFKDIPVLFLSSQPLDSVRDYKNTYFKSKMDEFIFGSIDLEHMKVLADHEPKFPTIMWFGKSGGLKVRNRGLIAPDRILRTIKQQGQS